MNKDKAIQLLERLQDPEPYEPILTKDAYDAIQMAIDALSADGDTISREAAIEVIDSFNVFESRCDQIKLEQMIGELPPANNSEIPNSSDTISRAKAIEALDKRFDSIPMEQTSEILMLRKDLRELPPAQPEQLGTNLASLGTDCISRQAAIEALKNDMASIDHIIKGMSANDVRLDAYVSQRNQVNYDIYTINNLPSAQPEPYTDALKAEIRRMKRSFTICINPDYYKGYMSALSAVEGYIAHRWR